MTDEELAAIKTRAEAAMPGPWSTDDVESWYVYQVDRHSGVAKEVAEFTSRTTRKQDAVFIAHAREDIPALLAEVERSREIVRAVVAKGFQSAPAGTFESDAGWFHCIYCDRDAENMRRTDWKRGDAEIPGAEDGLPFLHTADCPVTKARAILGQ